ncbi:RHS repeat-associated core domain-containing protein [Lacipirellula sp.]|uniref:RHS repeat-associated core domain-containing protein n=1 Tax=Lacipirellula sp. TaxID=2691419 RepID=UPI003D1378B6
MPANFQGNVGANWMMDAFAYMTQGSGGELAFVWTPGRGAKSIWFTQSGSTYTAEFGARQTLVRDANIWRITDPDGTVWEFDAITELVSKQITPGGQVTEFLQNAGRIIEKRRTVGDDVESRVFDYTDNLVTMVTLYRGTVAQPHQTAVGRVLLAYYDSTIAHKGNAGDLKTVTLQTPQGVSWENVSVHYYRYYTSNSPTGYVGGLKYVVGPTAYASLIDPEGASDSQIAAVASKAYQYDPSTQRVIQAKTHGGSQTYAISYTESGFADGYNSWQLRAEATLPDGSTKIVYANHISQDMLVDNQQGSDRWITYVRFEDNAGSLGNHSKAVGRATHRYSPSAIDMTATPYDDSDPTLDVQLNANKGLVQITTYYADDQTAPGYPESKQVQQGTAGSSIKLQKAEYGSHTVGSGTNAATIYVLTKQIVYRSDASGGSDPVETTFTNEFHTGKTQLKKVTTGLPDVDAPQNGGAWLIGNTQIQEFDVQGRLEKETDPRGTVTEYDYDDTTGTVSQRTQDPTGLNLITNYISDGMGRIVETRDPAHDVNGQTVRTVEWTVYLDADHEVRRAKGYLIGTNSYTLVNPVSITRTDASGQIVDEINAVRGSGVENSGALTAGDSFPQSSWRAWMHNEYDDGRLQSTRIYHTIPASGSGSSGVNYDQTDFGDDAMGRHNYAKSPAGTIIRTVYDARGLGLSSWVGTNDDGATDANPAGSGSPNNMKAVAINQYDADAYGSGNNSLDGLLTKVTSPVDGVSANDRIVEYRYDWRDRRTTVITTDGTNVFHDVAEIDNLNRTVVARQERTGAPNVLTGKNEVFYDSRGSVYQTKRYAVSDAGVAGNALIDNTWYDAGGNVLKSLSAGSQAFTKTVYDAIGRQAARYVGYYSGTGDDAPQSVTNDVIFEESQQQYDAASNVTFSTAKQRWHDATGNGALNGHSGSQPKSRDSYSASWYDGSGRLTATANYGTNNNAGPPTRPSSAPAPSDTMLVSTIAFNSSGQILDQTDPVGQVTRSGYDAARRVTSVVSNYGSSPTEEVQTTYTADGQVATLTAINGTTGSQTTTYAYGVDLTNSAVATKDLLRMTTCPDNGYVTYEYNRQSQRTKMADQNGSIHEYAYDKLGRQTDDRVTTIAGGVDGAVRRLEWTYDNRQRLQHVLSRSATSGGSVTSDVQYAYNDFSQLATEYQQHGAAVNVSTSPKVQYAYENGSTNTIRPTGSTYPNSNALSYGYGSSGGKNDKLSRIEKLAWKGTDVATYEYLGLGQFVIEKYPEPSTDVEYTLVTSSGSNPYAGMDRFGRIVDLQWKQGSTELVRLGYGYDRAGNRTYRRDEVARTNSAFFDELYGYDGLNRLTSFDRGLLNGANTGLTGSPTLTQDWTLDQTGNWSGFSQTVQSALTQTRTSNTVNEITDISETVGLDWATPAYNANGNMSSLAQPGTLDDSYTATWDAWNRLVKLADSSGVVAEYQYDGLNRRAVKSIPGFFGTVRHYYYSDQWQVIEERLGSSTSADQQQVWGSRYVDNLVLRDRFDVGPGYVNRLYALQDALFNVVALTTSAGAVQERFAYQPYGQSEPLNPNFSAYSGTDYQWEYRFTGREIDLESGLQINRRRYLHIQLGRWMSRDPMEYYDGPNVYRYVASNPVKLTDPSGLACTPVSYIAGPTTVTATAGGFSIGPGTNPGTVSAAPTSLIECTATRKLTILVNCVCTYYIFPCFWQTKTFQTSKTFTQTRTSTVNISPHTVMTVGWGVNAPGPGVSTALLHLDPADQALADGRCGNVGVVWPAWPALPATFPC